MTETQKQALDKLLNIKCKVASENEDNSCDGPWCSTRKEIVTAFELAQRDSE